MLAERERSGEPSSVLHVFLIDLRSRLQKLRVKVLERAGRESDPTSGFTKETKKPSGR